jgi:hypothetical protein
MTVPCDHDPKSIRCTFVKAPFASFSVTSAEQRFVVICVICGVTMNCRTTATDDGKVIRYEAEMTPT